MAGPRYLTWPNRMTMLRLILIGPFVVALLNLKTPGWEDWARYAALAIFGVMAISDGLDGYLARRFNQESLLGRFLDPVVDKLLVTSAMVLLGMEGTAVAGFQIPSWVVVSAIGKDVFVVVGFLLVFIVTGQVFIKPGWSGKLCTDAQLLLVVTVLLGPDLVRVGPTAVRGVLWALWCISAVLAILTCWLYYRKGARFAHQVEQGEASP